MADAFAGVATATGSAFDAMTDPNAFAEVAPATGTAHAPAAKAAPNVQVASATGSANNLTFASSTSAFAPLITATGTAHNATVIVDLNIRPATIELMLEPFWVDVSTADADAARDTWTYMGNCVWMSRSGATFIDESCRHKAGLAVGRASASDARVSVSH